MSDSTVCHYCRARRPTTEMILVEPVPQLPETDPREEEIWFCNWTCLAIYAQDVITP